MDEITVTVMPLEGGELTSKQETANFADFLAKEIPVYEILLKNKVIKDYTIMATNGELPVTITVKSKRNW